jgi:hypothetical protein
MGEKEIAGEVSGESAPDATRTKLFASRVSLLAQAAKSPQLQALLREKCRRDIRFWFNHFCWTFDPRLAQPHRPFRLYAYQEKALDQIVAAIERGEDLLVEKSRDMGISWLILMVFQYFWLFRPGSNFHLGSRKLEMVDRKGDMSTLFEKLRYNLDWLPDWMMPPGYKRGSQSPHDNEARLLNPANRNVITGESSNGNFGRGGRYRAVLFDEFPFWPDQDAAYASAGQSTPCRLVVGTPFGKNNRFAALRFSGLVKVLSLHWREHPHKDEAWYAQQKTRMSEDELARELDINYELSRPDRVFRNFGEQHKTELDWLQGVRIIRSWDFGYHCPACLFLQIDADGRVLVLHEVVGSADLLTDFAKRVQEAGRERFPRAEFEDICDPAGSQKSDKSTRTSIEILNTLGIYPYFDRSGILDGIELIRLKLAPVEMPDEFGQISLGGPGLLIDRRCLHLIAAFEGGYRYAKPEAEMPHQEHPYEDVMDCLRYAVMAKCGLLHKNPRKPKPYRPGNRYTGY